MSTRIPTIGGDTFVAKRFADGSGIIYIPSVVDKEEHEQLLNVHYPTLEYHPEKSYYGNPPCRDTTWNGPFDYHYAAKVERAQPTPEWLDQLRVKIERETVRAIETLNKLLPDKSTHFSTTGIDFRGILTNRYKNGQDSITLDADNESTLRSGAPIASFSLGAVRSLLMRHAQPKAFPSMRIRMNSGSLLIMLDCQRDGRWKHGVEKDDTQTVRYNSTFRVYAGQNGEFKEAKN